MVSDLDTKLDEVYNKYGSVFSSSDIQKLKEITKNPELTKWLISSIGSYGNIVKKRLGSSNKLNITEILDRLKPSIEFMKNNKNLESIKLGDYIIKTEYGFPKHVENVIEFKIYSKENKIIGTIGFVISKNKKGLPQLIMNHLQGPEPNINTLETINKLNKDLGVSWRNLVIRFLRNYAHKNKFKFIYLLPRDFNGSLPEKMYRTEYKRQLRMYINSALKAGVLPEEIAFSKVPKKSGNKIKKSLKATVKGKSLKELRKINVYKLIK